MGQAEKSGKGETSSRAARQQFFLCSVAADEFTFSRSQRVRLDGLESVWRLFAMAKGLTETIKR